MPTSKKKTNEYLKELDKADKHEQQEKIKNISEKLIRLKTEKIKYEILSQELNQTGDLQISTTDANARALLIHGQVVEVSYNTQAAVDHKHKLVVGTHTINRNERNALSNIALETRENIQSESFTI